MQLYEYVILDTNRQAGKWQLMISRRKFGEYALAGLTAMTLPRAATAAKDLNPILREDGTYTQSWFLESFLELKDDLEESRAEGKRFAILWEQAGCPYCRETHMTNFAQPEIRDFVEAHFNILQLDIWGSREIVDFDGSAASEKKMARKNNVRFTPTIQFFPPSTTDVGQMTAKQTEILRMPGYFKPQHFLTMFQYIQEEAYKNTKFQPYLKAKLSAVKTPKKAVAW